MVGNKKETCIIMFYQNYDNVLSAGEQEVHFLCEDVEELHNPSS